MFHYLNCMSVPTSPLSVAASRVQHQCSPTNIEATPQKCCKKTCRRTNSSASVTVTDSPVQSVPYRKQRSLRHQPSTEDVVCTLSFEASSTPTHSHKKRPAVSPASAAFSCEISTAISSHVAVFLGDASDTSLGSSTDSGFCSLPSDQPGTARRPRDSLVCSSKSRHSSAAAAVGRHSHSHFSIHRTLAVL